MADLTTHEQLIIFAQYLGQDVWVHNLYANYTEQTDRAGVLKGINDHGLLLELAGGVRCWFNLLPQSPAYTFRLLLKPCSRLTPEIIEAGRSLPASSFMVPFYRNHGYDLPVFLKPGHPANTLNIAELCLADYRSKEDILGLAPAKIIRDAGIMAAIRYI